MELEVFVEQEKNGLPVIEIAHATLEKCRRDHEIYFSDLVNEIQNYPEKSDAEIREVLPYFYFALNVDGSFIPLGDNKWGLRSWCVTDKIDEEITTPEEDESGAPKRKLKYVNVFMDGDEDVTNYSDGDPEDEDPIPESPDLEYDEKNPNGEKLEVESHDSEINGIISDEDLDEEIDINEEDDEDDGLDEEQSPALVFY